MVYAVCFQQGTIDLEVMFVAPDEDSDEDHHDYDDENHFRWGILLSWGKRGKEAEFRRTERGDRMQGNINLKWCL